MGTAIAPPGRNSPIIHILAGALFTGYNWHMCTHLRILQACCMCVGKRPLAEMRYLVPAVIGVNGFRFGALTDESSQSQ